VTVRRLDVAYEGLWEGTVAVGQVEAWRSSVRGLDAVWEASEEAVRQILAPSDAAIDWVCEWESRDEAFQREPVWYGRVSALPETPWVFEPGDRIETVPPSPFEFDVDLAEAEPGVSPWNLRRVANSGVLEATIVRGLDSGCFMAQVDVSLRDERTNPVRTVGAYNASTRFDFLVEWVEEYVGYLGDSYFSDVVALDESLPWRRIVDVEFNHDNIPNDYDYLKDEYWKASLTW
jgi:hypothetical protein